MTPAPGFITISEYTWNRPKSMILPGGSTKQFEYDPLMRVKSITAKDPGQNVLLNYQYSHDKVDNITQKATEHGDYGYDYDDLYRLSDVDNPDINDEAFTYDGVGNRLTSEGVTGGWSYNTNNELTGYDNVSYVYDANGNTTNITNGTNETKYIYNTEDRMTEVRDGSNALIASYYYDPFGRRLWKELSGVRTYFHYADEGLIGEYDSTGAEIKTYGYKPGSTWTTDPLFMKEGSNYYFYYNDHLGTPQKMTAVNGAVVWAAKYSSFGEAIVDAASTITSPLLFPGQYEDTETGLHYNYNRYYDQRVGRYLRIDPLGIRGDDIISRMPYHLYSYSDNSPTNKIDPKGQFAVHGNFCGAGYGNLQNDLPLPKSKDGGLDRCCYRHDACYKKNGVKPPYGQVWCDEEKSIEQLSCDQKMISCLRKTKPPAKYLHIKYSMLKTFGGIKPENFFEIPF